MLSEVNDSTSESKGPLTLQPAALLRAQAGTFRRNGPAGDGRLGNIAHPNESTSLQSSARV